MPRSRRVRVEQVLVADAAVHERGALHHPGPVSRDEGVQDGHLVTPGRPAAPPRRCQRSRHRRSPGRAWSVPPEPVEPRSAAEVVVGEVWSPRMRSASRPVRAPPPEPRRRSCPVRPPSPGASRPDRSAPLPCVPPSVSPCRSLGRWPAPGPRGRRRPGHHPARAHSGRARRRRSRCWDPGRPPAGRSTPPGPRDPRSGAGQPGAATRSSSRTLQEGRPSRSARDARRPPASGGHRPAARPVDCVAGR